MGDLGDDGDLDLGADGDLDLGGEGELDLGGEELGGQGDDTALLATPGRREDNPKKNRHQGAKHVPVKVDRRRGSAARHSAGPMRREMRNTAIPEAPVSRTTRTKLPGALGMPDFKSLVGLEEQEQPTYTNDETVLCRNTTKVRRLVEAMERKEEEKNET